MKLVYDNIVYSLQQAGGISTYWAELSSRLIRDNYDISFIEQENSNIIRQTLPIKDNQLLLQNVKYSQILSRFLPVNLNVSNEKFIFHSSYNRVTNNINAVQVTTVHDFVHEKYYGGLRKLIHSYQKNKSINAAQKIIAVSENTKRDLLEIHPKIDPSKIEVIYNGVSEDFFIIDKAVDGAKPYLLFIGSREHYKNFNFVVELLKEASGFDLYIIGKPLLKDEEKLLLRSIPGRFKLFTNIDNKSLNVIYNEAFALIYPSSYEGFGIPLLEAMKAGLPFIALNKSSIPEVAGRAGELIDELSIDGFKQALNRIANARNDYVLKGLKQAQFFSWEKCYQKTISLYHNLVLK